MHHELMSFDMKSEDIPVLGPSGLSRVFLDDVNDYSIFLDLGLVDLWAGSFFVMGAAPCISNI